MTVPDAPPAALWRRIAGVLGAVAVSASAFAILQHKVWVDFLAVAEQVGSSRLGWLAVAVLLVPVQVVLAAERWRMCSAELGLPLDRRAAAQEFGLGMALNQILPGGVGGDVVRVWRQRRRGWIVATRAAVADRMVGWVVLAATAAAGLLAWTPLTGTPAPEGALPAAASVAALGLAVIALPKGIFGIGTLSSDARSLLFARPLELVGLSLALTVSILASFGACALAVDGQPGGWLLTAGPVALLAMSIPLSFAGWGLREASLVPLLAMLGWSPETALATSVLAGITLFIGALPGLLVLWLSPAKPET